MTSANDLRSLRSWIGSMYPDAVIHIQRNTARIGKPWFFIEQSDERYQDRGSGYHEYLRTFLIHLVSEGVENTPAPEMLWKTRGVLDYICEEAVTKRVIPAYLYNTPYPRPQVTTRTGTTIAAGTHRFAVTVTTTDGQESMLSPEVVATVAAPKRSVVLLVPIWQPGYGAIRYVRVYYRDTATANWRNILLVDRATQTSPVVIIPDSPTHTLEVPIPALNVDLQHDAPQTSRLRNGFLKVQEASVQVSESTMLDDMHHGFVRLRLLSRSHHTRRPASTITQITTSATISP